MSKKLAVEEHLTMEDGKGAVNGLWPLGKTAFALGITPAALMALAKDADSDMGLEAVSVDGHVYFDPDDVDAWIEQCIRRTSVLRDQEAYIWKLTALDRKGPERKEGGPTLVN
jgi:hypothetical protein